jgi:hypothetical protein
MTPAEEAWAGRRPGGSAAARRWCRGGPGTPGAAPRGCASAAAVAVPALRQLLDGGHVDVAVVEPGLDVAGGARRATAGRCGRWTRTSAASRRRRPTASSHVVSTSLASSGRTPPDPSGVNVPSRDASSHSPLRVCISFTNGGTVCRSSARARRVVVDDEGPVVEVLQVGAGQQQAHLEQQAAALEAAGLGVGAVRQPRRLDVHPQQARVGQGLVRHVGSSPVGGPGRSPGAGDESTRNAAPSGRDALMRRPAGGR